MSMLDLISEHASPGTIINAYSLFGIAHLSSRANRNRHYRENLAFWKSDMKTSAFSADGRFIERQDRLTGLRYGGGRGYPLSYGGCEMIAVYNLISFLNDGRIPAGFDLPDIIMAFEKDGVALEGAFGSSPKGMVRYLKKAGLSPLLMKPGQNLDPSSLQGKPFIFTAFNDRKRIKSQVHTMAATPEPEGRVCLHNSHESSEGCSRYRDPADAIINYRRGQGRAICVISLAS